MFKGTAKRSAIDITYELGALGAQANAFTSEENTVYYAGVLPEYLPAMQELLSDMVRPALDPQEFNTEKKVILEEIALYQDRPHYFLYEHASRDYFAKHGAGNSVLGSTESITALTRDQMKDYFDRRYSASNAVLVATGNFDWHKLVSDTERLCGSWSNFQSEREIARHALAVPIKREYRKKNLVQSHLLLMTEGASAQDKERFALAVLSSIIGDSSGSKLYWNLVDPGIAESAGADNDEKDGAGVFMVQASFEPEKLDQIRSIVFSCLQNPREFSDEDLQRAKTKLMSRLVLQGELPMGRLMSIGLEWNYRHEVESLVESVELVRAVQRRDIEAAIERFALNSWSEFVLLPA